MERIVLTATEGMVYTNGVAGGKVIYLAEGESAADWYEISVEEYIRCVESGQTVGAATEEDYQAALAEFGVAV